MAISSKFLPFQNAVKNLWIEVSELENSGLLGAAALYFDQQK